MTSRSDLAVPGFFAIPQLGVSDVLYRYMQGVGSESGHGYALRIDGTVWEWEARSAITDGVMSAVRFITRQVVPLRGVTTLVGESTNSGGCRFALQSDGTVWGWGEEYFREAGVRSIGDHDAPIQHSGLSQITALVATRDGETRLALKADGTVWSWGSNYFGGLGDPNSPDRIEAARIPNLTDIVQILATREDRFLALDSKGRVFAWGAPLNEARGDAHRAPRAVEGAPRLVALYDDCGIDEAGTVWLWGSELTAQPVAGLTPVATVIRDSVAGGDHTFHALTEDGRLFGWGENAHGEIGDSSTEPRATPVPVSTLSNVKAVVASSAARWALSADGTVWQWGGVGFEDGLGATPQRIPLPRADEAAMFERWGSLGPTTDPSPAISANALVHEDSGLTLLMHWSSVGEIREVRKLIGEGANLNLVDGDGDSALFYAAHKGHREIVELLLANGADPRIGGTTDTLLHLAAGRGWLDIVTQLLKSGISADSRGRAGSTPLMRAVASNNRYVLDALAQAGASLDAVDHDGDSALYYAASRGRVQMVQALVALGADPSPRAGASGFTPLSAARTLAAPGSRRPSGTSPSDFEAIEQILVKATETGNVPAARSRMALPESPPPRPEAVRRGRVEVNGSWQTGLARKPTVKIYWRGEYIGEVRHGGRCTFEIDGDGLLEFSSTFRRASLRIDGAQATVVQLAWHPTSGRLIATSAHQ